LGVASAAIISHLLKACFDPNTDFILQFPNLSQLQTLRQTSIKPQHHFLNIVTMPAQNDVEMQYQSAQQMDPTKPSPSALAVSLSPEPNDEQITDI
jgi:hypothetical protein